MPSKIYIHFRNDCRHAVLRKPAHHPGSKSLTDGDIALRIMMNASHVSLRDDYEVTGIELDTLVEETWKCTPVSSVPV